MTSILDQYNSNLRRAEDATHKITDPPTSGYVTFRSKDLAPIFTKQKMKLDLPQDITHLTVSNNWLVCLMSHNVLLRFFINRADKHDEVFLEKYVGGYSISNLFFDPSGNHLFISLTPKSPSLSPDFLYLHRKNDKPKRIDKFKDHEITAIAFNLMNGNDLTTGPILLGTSKGFIFESEFGIEGEKLYHNNWKQLPNYIPIYGIREIEGLVFDLGRRKPCQITGLDFFRVPKTNRFIVIATTIDKIYKFQEVLKSDDKLVLQNIFNAYHNSPDELLIHKSLTNDLRLSKLRFTCDVTRKFPTQFGWLNEQGIFFAKIHQTADNPNFILNETNIPFPNETILQQYEQQQLQQNTQSSSVKTTMSTTNKYSKTPKSFILTDFHALLLYTDHIIAVNLLNQSIIYEEYFQTEQIGNFLNIVKDIETSSVYVYTSKTVFRYKITNEKRDVWKMYLKRKEYALAEHYSQDNPAHLDIVLCQKAEMEFLNENYIESALIYSETQMSFECVALKFLDLNDKKPLMIFLNNRLAKLSENDKTQITMLVVWMVELYLTEIARKNDDFELQKDFDNFMQQYRVKQCVCDHRTVIYDLMASHGDSHNLTILTTVNKDYESVINQYINQGKYNDALGILRTQNKPELYYKYCPILMEEIPHETIAAIKSQDKRLNPEKLIPTIICLQSDEHIKAVIKYLEYAVYKMSTPNKPINNFLIKLYAEHRQDQLEMYLEAQGRDISSVDYDVHYALRVCEEHQAKVACVFLHCLLELWQSAVELALTFDSKLAQTTASKPIDDDLKRKLWLKIAEHEIKGKNDVKRALELLKECDLLRIEDLLPFFSNFQKIDDFKSAICDALKEYNLKIKEQKRDMDDSAKSAERVRQELQTLRNRHIVITAQEQCSICEIYLMLKPFFVFPCGHKFHSDCLEKQIIPYLNSDECRRLSSLKQQLETMLTINDPTGSQQQAQYNGINSREQIKMNIEKILASDCLYCGIMIDAIDQPFIEDWDQVNVDWQ